MTKYISLFNEAKELFEQGRIKDAESHFNKALNLCRDQNGDVHDDVSMIMNQLALLYRNQERPEEAEPLLLESLEICTNLYEEDHPEISICCTNLGVLYIELTRYSEAKIYLHRAAKIVKDAYGENSDYAHRLNNLASLYMMSGDYIESERNFRKALNIQKKELGEEHIDVVTTMNNLAGLMSRKDDYNEAIKIYVDTLNIAKKFLDEKDPKILNLERKINFECYKRMIDTLLSNSIFKQTIQSWSAPTNTNELLEASMADPILDKKLSDYIKYLLDNRMIEIE